ncbi:ferritin-like domain-containing protein [Pseudanabaena sp. FACHB-2040]|uniref:ferritin-like domain-containing protein n=1 Tax=Pseudanabaena sp. FACHB-2040 TaxID=2692859 RepID=UPI001683687F|nr:ferritin-like domain-containing protein [Pseudanabaena sp. FACHB-2040]MBD2255976.1 ferritin-like domain-containing protein [Pseudanabaena sp. FACHB-2040]
MERRLTFPQKPHGLSVSRRRMVIGGLFAGATSAVGLSALAARPAKADDEAAANDAAILNGALYYEHQAIWAYSTAAGFLSNTDVGKAVLKLALANQADHKVHRDTLAEVITSLGGTPVDAESEYDLSAYLERGDGGLDSDANIAKLALALETDAAIAYATEVSMLKTPALITAGASIAATEASHATAIRAAFISLGMDIAFVPAPFFNGDNRDEWVIKV